MWYKTITFLSLFFYIDINDMLTKGQQYLILQLYDKIKKERELFEEQKKYMQSDEQEVYTNKNTFYESINYLIEAGFIEKKKKGKTNLYRLTFDGEALAMLLLNLPDLPEDFSKAKGRLF